MSPLRNTAAGTGSATARNAQNRRNLQAAEGTRSATAALLAAGLDPDAVADLVRRGLAEDLPPGPVGALDATSTATVDPALAGTAVVASRADGIVAGLPVAAAVFEAMQFEAMQFEAGRFDAGLFEVGPAGTGPAGDAGPAGAVPAFDPASDAGRAQPGGGQLTVTLLAADGDRVRPGDVVLTVTGPVRLLLTAERTALNLLCHLSGVASATRQWVDAVSGTGAAIRDTRKTLPGLRALQKYAVRCGGGHNHRMSLADAALVKDNHIVAAGGVAAAFAAVRSRFPGLPVEVECDTVEQVAEAVAAGADLILCDNMSLDELRASVALARPAGVRLEASGGLTLDVARAVAGTGVDFLAVGALTHSARALDLGLDLDVGLQVDSGPGPDPVRGGTDRQRGA